MKTASEYRALAWNDLRTKFGKSLGIIYLPDDLIRPCAFLRRPLC